MKERNKETSFTPRSGETVETKLLRIAEKAQREKNFRFTSLFHLMNQENLWECFESLRNDSAPGIDKMTKIQYAKRLESRLNNLTDRLHRMAYIPQTVRRVYIPKTGSNKMRPLGIPTIEDKLVQAGLVRIMESIYEQDFIEDSYGFRPNRGCHTALRQLNRTLHSQPVNYIVDADIKGFFDNVDQDWMIRFLEHRIADKRLLRIIKRILKAGVIEEGKVYKSEKGTPQGGVISPLLANIYLHYVLDLWFENGFKKGCKGYCRIIRYADDFVVCFQNRCEADRFLKELKERLLKFGLEVEPTKTKVIAFGKRAYGKAKREGEKLDTFDFLGFTHYCSKSRDGGWVRIKRRTEKKKFHAKLKEIKEWLKASRVLPTGKLMKRLSLKLSGHYAYYGVTDNFAGIDRFGVAVQRLLKKWLNRRGRTGCMTWEKLRLLLKRYPLPKPRILVSLF